MAKLLAVKRGFFVQYPDGIGPRNDRVWLMPGEVVDIDDAYTQFALAGQMHKFEEARGNAAITAEPLVISAAREQWTKSKQKPKAAEAKKAEASKIAAGIGSISNIERPSIQGKKS